MIDFVIMGKLCMPCEEEVERIICIEQLRLKANDKTIGDDIELSPLDLACAFEDESTVKDLLEQNVNVDIPVTEESKLWPGWTAVHFAACFNFDIMLLLIKNGADIMKKNAKGETALDLCSQRFTLCAMQSILSTKKEFKDIVLSDNCTKLLDLLSIMDDCEKFNDLLHRQEDVNLIVPYNSPIWAGYSLLHLSVLLNGKSIHCKNNIFDYDPDIAYLTFDWFHCTEETSYWERIQSCLKYGCSVDMKNVKGQTPLHLAFVMLRETNVVKKLLSCSKENVIDQSDLSHLHIACALGKLEAVKRYLNQGADVNSRVRTKFNWHEIDWTVLENSTPLHVATAFCHNRVVEYLLESKANVYSKDSLDFTPIHLSMLKSKTRYTDNTLSRLLLEKTPNLHNAVSKAGLSHLHVSVHANDPDAVKKLLVKGAEVDGVIDVDVESLGHLADYAGQTPLHVALRQSDNEIVKTLLKRGANVHAKDSRGISALQYAIQSMESGSIVTLIRMLKRGKYDVEGSGVTLLHFACGYCDITWAKKLLKKGADVNARIDAETRLKGATPLYLLFGPFMSCGGDPQILVDFVELLLDNGADVTIDCCGSTPLHEIYEPQEFGLYVHEDGEVRDEPNFPYQVVDSMLESQRSYNVNPTDNRGFSHFHYACIMNNVEVVKKFLDNGANLNRSVYTRIDLIGSFTPLHFALAYHSREVALLLLERGADVNAKDDNGNRPLHVAFKRKFVDMELIKTMLSLGADIHSMNRDEETAFHCLLKYGGLTLQALEFFLNCGYAENILGDHEGIIGLAMRSVAPTGSKSILERLMQIDEVKREIQSGFNVIHSVVSIKQKGELTLDNYLSAIEFLMGIGCELDDQGRFGRTALQTAVNFYNLEAVEALLQLGAEINVIDNVYKSSFSHGTICTANSNNKPREIDVVKIVAGHIWKMKSTQLIVNDANLEWLEYAEQLIPRLMPFISSLEEPCRHELTKAQETSIDGSLTVKDFLSELGAVARYPRMNLDRRIIVEKFFKDSTQLSREFPQFCGLLTLQYRKALARIELWKPAKEAIVSICQFAIPDLCLDEILRFLTNDEMKLTIKLEKQIFNHS